MRDYQIPRNVSAKFEFWPGFGWVELFITIAGILTGLAFRYIVLWITGSQWGLLFIALFGAAGYFLVKPLTDGGDSFLASFRRFRKYLAGQKLYLHLRRDEWFRKRPAPDRAQTEKRAAQDWLPVKDIVGGVLHKRDGSIVAVLRVDALNISLKSDHEKQRIIGAVHEAINGQREPFQIICLPRALDLDQYLSGLNDRLKGTTNGFKRRLLAEYRAYVAGLVTEGDVLERRYYILLEQRLGPGKRRNQREELQKRCYELAGSLGAAGLRVGICNDSQIIDLLFSFLNPRQAAYENAPDGMTTFTRVVY